jgi:beta-glucosidase
MSQTVKFCKDFLWGAATSSYQIEGNNRLCDWYQWEQDKKVPYSCGKACDSYFRFPEDFDIASSLGHTAHRFSLEWSRIQPEADRFDQNEINHYKQVLIALRGRGLEPVLTLFHFTNPIWFNRLGGWQNEESEDYFLKYVKRVVSELGEFVKFWITLNEPLVYLYNSYYTGLWPPGESSLLKVKKGMENLYRAHSAAYDIIHSFRPAARVSIAKHMRFFLSCREKDLGQNRIPVFLRNRVFNYYFLDLLVKRQKLDFIGINFYTGDFVKFCFKDIFGKDCHKEHHRQRKNNLNWYIDSEKMTDILLSLKRYRLPLLITENGTTEDTDTYYAEFLKQHISAVARALLKGADVFGYIWWSLLDNYEWDKGFKPKFGLVEVDKDMNRKLKPFAGVYKDICFSNRIKLG